MRKRVHDLKMIDINDDIFLSKQGMHFDKKIIKRSVHFDFGQKCLSLLLSSCVSQEFSSFTDFPGLNFLSLSLLSLNHCRFLNCLQYS